MLTADKVIKILNLEPLPVEGGLFRETYTRRRTPDELPYSTAIYYMLTGTAFSHIHKLDEDEMFHFYLGSPVELLLLYPEGGGRMVTLGTDLEKGQVPQFVVPAGVWQGSTMALGGEYALLGTTMAPGYNPASYVHGEREALISRYPEFEAMIKRLTT